jgi:hypothetical protein
VLVLRGADRKSMPAMQQFLSEGTWDDIVILQRLWPQIDAALGHDDGC